MTVAGESLEASRGFELVGPSPWVNFRFHGFASAVKTRDMGVRVEIEDGESLADGLKRLRVLLHEEGGHPISHAKWHKRRLDRYEKPSVLRRRRRWVAVEKRIRGWDAGPEELSYSNYFFTF